MMPSGKNGRDFMRIIQYKDLGGYESSVRATSTVFLSGCRRLSESERQTLPIFPAYAQSIDFRPIHFNG